MNLVQAGTVATSQGPHSRASEETRFEDTQYGSFTLNRQVNC